MRLKLEIIMCGIVASMIGTYYMYFIDQERDVLRFICGEMIIALPIAIGLIILFLELDVRDKRKEKRNEKTIRNTK